MMTRAYRPETFCFSLILQCINQIPHHNKPTDVYDQQALNLINNFHIWLMECFRIIAWQLAIEMSQLTW